MYSLYYHNILQTETKKKYSKFNLIQLICSSVRKKKNNRGYRKKSAHRKSKSKSNRMNERDACVRCASDRKTEVKFNAVSIQTNCLPQVI